jgi:hypothetical protein
LFFLSLPTTTFSLFHFDSDRFLSRFRRPKRRTAFLFLSVWNSLAVEQRISPSASRPRDGYIGGSSNGRYPWLCSIPARRECCRHRTSPFHLSPLQFLTYLTPMRCIALIKALFLVALLSTLVLSFVLLRVAWTVSASTFKRTPYQEFSREAFFFRSQLGQYATCLLVSNWIRAVSGMIDADWITAGGVKAGERKQKLPRSRLVNGD